MKKKLQYWFDNQMSKGPVSMVLMLAGATLAVLIFVVALINIFEPNEDGIIFTTWDSLSAIINAWMPYSDEGGVGYLIPTAFAALFGLLFTSVLIGIVGSAIEDKINSLRKGNSVVAESNHTVVLGYEAGAYELISQLISGAGGNRFCLVVAGKEERDTAEEEIRSNVSVPSNVKLIYRSADICDANSLLCCSIETASMVIVNAYDNFVTFKSILAVVKLLREYSDTCVKIVAPVTRDEYILPKSLTEKKNILMIQTNDVIARMIAHSCLQPGIAQTFVEIFSFTGSEIYVDEFEEYAGMSFGDLYQRLDKAVPVGFLRNENAILCPKQEEILEKGDKLIYIAKERGKLELSQLDAKEINRTSLSVKSRTGKNVTIFGYNEKVGTLVDELPENIESIVVVNVSAEGRETYEQCVRRKDNCSVTFAEVRDFDRHSLSETVKNADHVILLSDHDLDREKSDVQNMMLYLKLLDIQIEYGYHFNTTAELFYENNRELIMSKKTADFVVANNMSSLLAAQIAATPNLIYVFAELLSKGGVEIRLLTPTDEQCCCKTVYELRQEAFRYGTVLIGYVLSENGVMTTYLNPGLCDEITIGKEDLLIGIC